MRTSARCPADLPPDELTVERAKELIAKGSGGPRELGADPTSGEMVLALTGRFGPFVQLGVLEEGSKAKPPRASLFKSMDPDTIDLETALKLLSLPRVVGADAEGNEITAQNGRYGPYLKKGTDSRSLETEDQIFNVTLAEAEAIFAQPEAGPEPADQAADPGVRGEPRHREAGPGARRPVRSLRHRRRHQRDHPSRHRPRCDHLRGGARPPPRTRGQGPGEEGRPRAAKKPAKKKTAKKAVKKSATGTTRVVKKGTSAAAKKAKAKQSTNAAALEALGSSDGD